MTITSGAKRVMKVTIPQVVRWRVAVDRARALLLDFTPRNPNQRPPSLSSWHVGLP